MECVKAEAALKSSFNINTTVKLSPQTLLEDLSSFNVQDIAPIDDFFVDDFLNFSNEEQEHEHEHEQDFLEEKQQNHTPQYTTQNQNQISHSILNNQFASLPTTELTVPVEEAADLEWLSYFVEDSFSEFPKTENLQLQQKAHEPKPTFSTPCFKTPVPAKARSKRTRTGIRVWPISLANSSSTSSSTTLSSSNLEECSKPLEKKAKRMISPDGEARGVPRRCSHCGVQKTPQWRAGPGGPKTLCNACGVRYKSGRLLPEYRPACSPTFSSELHSNHHRKVIEMRRKKEVVPGF